MTTPHVVKRKCKKCNLGILENRVKRPILVKVVLFWLPIKRYKCYYCNKKSYILPQASTAPSQNRLQAVY